MGLGCIIEMIFSDQFVFRSRENQDIEPWIHEVLPLRDYRISIMM
jgi:hypothetical protein